MTKVPTTSWMTPPGFTVTGETWDEARAKLTAICPDKIPEHVPQEVLDHRPQ